MKKIISLLIASIMLLCMVGCVNKNAESMAPMSVEDPNVYYFNRFGDDVMPIGGYIGPTPGFGWNGNYYPSQITDYHYGQVADCGLNFIVGMKPDYKVNSQDVLDSLYWADKNDVMYFVCDTYLFEVTESNKENPNKYLYVSLDEFKDRVSIYSEYDSFAGLVGRDEPWADMFNQIEEILYYFDQTFDDNKLLYLNSNSYQCPGGWFGGGEFGDANEKAMTIEEYMTEWFESFPTLGYYSYDTYPFLYEGTDYVKPIMFKNYSLVRSMSEQYGVPFWTFMQSGGNWGGTGYWRITTEGDMLWQVSTALAFGAKGYTYYPYNMPPESKTTPDDDGSLVGRSGQKTASWYYAQKANRQTQACDHILMKSQYKGMIHVRSGKEDSTNIIEMPEIETSALNGKFREVTSITGDNSITGCFNYQGKTMLYVVNNSVTKNDAEVVINLDQNRKYTLIKRAQETTGIGDKVVLNFTAGEGACIVID